MSRVSRRKFIYRGGTACAALGASGAAFTEGTAYSGAQTSQTRVIPDRGPQLDPEMVKEFVIAGHGNIEKVKALLARQPSLINATWDWGGGDWETSLGGAAHVGNKEIARLLLAQGARLDLFAAAMLGKLEIVKAAITAFPESRNTKGPHGITLLAHAKAGGEEAAAVMKYLQSLERSG